MQFREEAQDLVNREPFEPFRIKLVNGGIHDVFHPQNVLVLEQTFHLIPPEQNWVFFPLDKIASIEALIEDYEGESAAAAAGK